MTSGSTRRLLEVEIVGLTDILGVNNRHRESDSFVSRHLPRICFCTQIPLHLVALHRVTI